MITGVRTVQMQKHDMQTVYDYRYADCTNTKTSYQADCVYDYRCVCVITGVQTVCADCTNAETWYHADCM